MSTTSYLQFPYWATHPISSKTNKGNPYPSTDTGSDPEVLTKVLLMIIVVPVVE